MNLNGNPNKEIYDAFHPPVIIYSVIQLSLTHIHLSKHINKQTDYLFYMYMSALVGGE